MAGMMELGNNRMWEQTEWRNVGMRERRNADSTSALFKNLVNEKKTKIHNSSPLVMTFASDPQMVVRKEFAEARRGGKMQFDSQKCK